MEPTQRFRRTTGAERHMKKMITIQCDTVMYMRIVLRRELTLFKYLEEPVLNLSGA